MFQQVRGKAYARFLEDLREYLASFLKRTQPLVDLDEVNLGGEEAEIKNGSCSEKRSRGGGPGQGGVCRCRRC